MSLPLNGTWTTENMTPMPTARHNFTSIVLDNKIYCIGGSISSATNHYLHTTNMNEIYDPINNTWIIDKPAPISFYSAGVAARGRKIYYLSGVNARACLKNIFDCAISTK